MAGDEIVTDREDPEKKSALDELKQLIRTALNKHEFPSAPTPKVEATPTPTPTHVVATEDEPATTQEEVEEEVSIYGVPLLRDERSDVILLKFLGAKDFKVEEAFTMIKNTLLWRQEFGIDDALLLDEKEEKKGLGKYLEKVMFMYGCDREGHPVCYKVYSEFQNNKDLYIFTFSDEEKRQKFIRWMILFLEKSIRKLLDFSPGGGISTIVLITDLNNFPGLEKWELRQATNQTLHLLQDNYPEFVAKHIFINVPWWYRAFHKMIISPFLTQRTKSKFVFAGPSKSAETLLKYITPEQVPVQYGGLIKEGEMGFSSTDLVHEIKIKPGVKQTIEFSVSEACVLVWEVRVISGEVHYDADFVPTSQDGYRVTLIKTKVIISSSDYLSKKKNSNILNDHRSNKKSSSTDEPRICNSFKIGEPGKIVITIGNFTAKKKRILFRFTTNH